MFVYTVTNLIDSKVYVGQTRQKPNYRWSSHIRDMRNGNNKPLYKAMRLYGETSFKFEVVCECKDISSLNVCEKYIIDQKQSMVPRGYNVMPGGINYFEWKEEHRKQLSETQKLNPNNSGRFSKEKCTGTNNPFYGKKHNKETIKAILKTAGGFKFIRIIQQSLIDRKEGE